MIKSINTTNINRLLEKKNLQNMTVALGRNEKGFEEVVNSCVFYLLMLCGVVSLLFLLNTTPPEASQSMNAVPACDGQLIFCTDFCAISIMSPLIQMN